MKNKEPILVKGEWHIEPEYVFSAKCPKCKAWLNNDKVYKYDGEKFTKTMNCPSCRTKLKIKTEAV